MRIRSILMPTDFSACADAAFSNALFLAKTLDADLHVLHVLQTDPNTLGVLESYVPSRAALDQALNEEAERSLRDLEAEARTHGVAIQQDHRHGLAPAPTIVAFAEEHDIDLIVMGTHGRRGVRRLLLGSVTEETVRSAPCPVWTVRHGTSIKPIDAIRRIVVPDDFSDDALRSLLRAQDLAGVLHARIELVHVVPPPTPIGAGIPMPTPPSERVLTESAAASLSQRVAIVADPTVPIEPIVLHGNPAVEIAEHAHLDHADLIVIGSHGLSAMRRFLLGSVSERVLRTADCPVLVLRHGTEAGIVPRLAASA